MQTLRLNPDLLQPAFDALASRVESGRTGAGALAVATSEGVVRAEAFGTTMGRAVTLQDRFLLASITKPIVATAVVQLAAEGRISLAEPLRTYLPDLPDSHALITAWHVLTHTSGIPDDVFGDWTDRATREELVRRSFTRPLAFHPGSEYAYCSVSFYVIGELLARIDGVPFAEALRRRVLEPMGMTSTSFQALEPGRGLVLPEGMPEEPAGPGEAGEMLDYLASISMPGGGLWSTAGDLARFARAYLGGGSLEGARLLPPAFVDLIGREQTRGIREAPVDGVGPAREPHYALGWGKPGGDGDVPCTDRAIEHGGATGTRLFIDPGADLAVVVLANRWDVAETSRSVIAAVHSALVPA